MDLHSIVGNSGGTRKLRSLSRFLGLCKRERGKKNIVVGSNKRIVELADDLGGVFRGKI